MIENYLSRDEMKDCLTASFLARGIEKDAALGGALKNAFPAFKRMLENGKTLPLLIAAGSDLKNSAKAIFRSGRSVSKDGVEAAKQYVRFLGWALGASAMAGGVVGVGYNTLRARMQRQDPEEKFNNAIGSIYTNKKKELEDSMWMDRVRSMRDELKRGYKKMDPEEYASKYSDLEKALDERKE